MWWCGWAKTDWRRWMKILILSLCWLSVSLSQIKKMAHVQRRDGFPINKQRKCHKRDGNSCLHLFFPLSLCVSLSLCQKSSCSWPTLKKKTLKIASHHDMQKYQWELNMKAWRTKREEELQEKEANIKCRKIFFPTRVTVFLPVGPLLSLAPTKFLLQAFLESRGKMSK